MKHGFYLLFLLCMAALLCLGVYFVLQGAARNRAVENGRRKPPLVEELEETKETRQSASVLVFPGEDFLHA